MSLLRRVFFAVVHTALGFAAFLVGLWLIGVVASFLVFLSYEVRKVVVTVVSAILVFILVFFSSRNQSIKDTINLQFSPILNVMFTVVTNGMLIWICLYYGIQELLLYQIIVIAAAIFSGDNVGYFLGNKIAKEVYSGYIKTTNDDPIVRPGEEGRSWRDSL